MALDMKAIANSEGLIIHDGPTWNARKLGVLPWSSSPIALTSVQIDKRLVLTTEQGQEIWYRLLGTVTTDGVTNNDRWINARSGNNFYIAGMTADNDPCNIQTGDFQGVNTILPTDTITFTYDRLAAAKYGIAHAYRNSIPSEITSEGYPNNQDRATNRINPNFSIFGINILNIFNIPYADFMYTSGTNSSRFNSEAIWIGGMPATFSFDENANLSFEDCLAQNSNNDGDIFWSGWRFCREDYDTAIWKSHHGIVAYFSKYYSDEFNRQNQIDISNVIPQTQHGDMLALINFNPTYVSLTEFRMIAGDLTTYGAPCLGSLYITEPVSSDCLNSDVSLNRSNVVSYLEALNPLIVQGGNGLHHVKTGDYMYVERDKNVINEHPRHGYLVVGWGNVLSCDAALDVVWTFDAVTKIYKDFDIASSELNSVIPYVVDFPGGIDSISKPQNQLPRP
jgi:hypothetical protein